MIVLKNAILQNQLDAEGFSYFISRFQAGDISKVLSFFKLGLPHSYTFKMKIYTGKKEKKTNDEATRGGIVMEL